MVLSGRGFGKTRTGAEWILERERQGYRRFALVGETAADVRDVLVKGESGILACAPPWNRPLYEPSKRRLVWPSGAQATCYSGDKPDQLRGPQHDSVWCDELAKFRYADDAWENAELGCRLSLDPRLMVTTTPRPIPIIRELVGDDEVIVVRGSTYENRANLPARFILRIRKRYEGTRLGRQEIYAEILGDTPGALWTRDLLERQRIKPPLEGVDEWYGDLLATMDRVVVAIDPSGSSDEEADEQGILTAGRSGDRGFLLDDRSGHYTPKEWGQHAVNAYYEFQADHVVVEANYGGDMVPFVINQIDPNVPVHIVHASRGKIPRAEPISTIYEAKRIFHVGLFAQAEDELCNYVAGPGQKSPNRLDALVWAFTDLMLEAEGGQEQLRGL